MGLSVAKKGALSGRPADDTTDLLIVGGGIHGAAVARDAAGRGLSVRLVERGDLAGETSGASSKLIHGGLRYLERLDVGLVREALREREVLLDTAPHLVQPLRFVLPWGRGQRPAWQIRLGLCAYDLLGGRRSLPGSASLRLDRGGPYAEPLQDGVTRGFLYSDCRTDDARLVIANALDAAARGARIETRTELLSARRVDGLWEASLRASGPGAAGAASRKTSSEGTRTVRARALIDTAGPWALQVRERVAAAAGAGQHRLRLVKGSHLVVPRLHEGEHAYILPQPDGRIVFAIPFEEDYTLVGTTEVVLAEPGPVAISAAETEYLRAAVGHWLRRPLDPGAAVWAFAGTRALADDGRASASAVSREDVIEVQGTRDEAPLLVVLGGKLTTARRLAERVLARLAKRMRGGGDGGDGAVGAPSAEPAAFHAHLAGGRAWTAGAALPGGDLPARGRSAPERLAAFVAELRDAHPELPRDLLAALARRHGSLARELLAGARTLDDLGPAHGAGLHERELHWFVEREGAATLDDVLWRRGKFGLRLRAEQRLALEARLVALAPRRGFGHASRV